MGDHQKAAAALSHMPRWVAVHDSTLAMIDAVLAVDISEGSDPFLCQDLLDQLDAARRERDRATVADMDAAPEDGA